MRAARRLVPLPLKVLARAIRPAKPEHRPLPPGVLDDAGKHAVLREVAQRYGTKVLVETGTYRGDTTAAMRKVFDRIYTIELHDELYRRATWRFVLSPSVTTIHGDSAEELERLLPRIDAPTLFWLDAHYSRGGVLSAKGKYDPPLPFELRAVLGLRDARHVVLIDDARLFGVEPGYPSIAEVEQIVAESGLPLVVETRDDIVRIHTADG